MFFIYSEIKHRKAASPHICEAGTKYFFSFVPLKLTLKINTTDIIKIVVD